MNKSKAKVTIKKEREVNTYADMWHKTDISERDPAWTVLITTGISEVYHMPSVVAALTSSAGKN